MENIKVIEKSLQDILDEEIHETWLTRQWHSFYFHVIDPINDFRYGLMHLPGNLKKWSNFVWRDRDWDYMWTLEALEIKCKAQSKLMRSSEHSKQADQIDEFTKTLKRYRIQKYLTDEEYDRAFNGKNSVDALFRLEELRTKADLKIINVHIKNMPTWWD